MAVKDTEEERVKHVLHISPSCSNGNLNQTAQGSHYEISRVNTVIFCFLKNKVRPRDKMAL